MPGRVWCVSAHEPPSAQPSWGDVKELRSDRCVSCVNPGVRLRESDRKDTHSEAHLNCGGPVTDSLENDAQFLSDDVWPWHLQ